jgi:hypothetical protein
MIAIRPGLGLETKPDQLRVLDSLTFGLARVRSDQIVIALRIPGHPLPFGGLRRLGRELVACKKWTDLPSRRRLDHPKRNFLVVSHQQETPIADGLDPRGFEHTVQPICRLTGSRRFEERRGERQWLDGNVIRP